VFRYGSVFHYGSGRKSYTAINHHVSTKVRASCGLGRTSNSNDLQRRHKVPARGSCQFSYRVIFDDYGVWKMTVVQQAIQQGGGEHGGKRALRFI